MGMRGDGGDDGAEDAGEGKLYVLIAAGLRPRRTTAIELCGDDAAGPGTARRQPKRAMQLYRTIQITTVTRPRTHTHTNACTLWI